LKLTIDPRDHFKIIAGLVPATHPIPKYTWLSIVSVQKRWTLFGVIISKYKIRLVSQKFVNCWRHL
jgi:hypothetical protein